MGNICSNVELENLYTIVYIKSRITESEAMAYQGNRVYELNSDATHIFTKRIC